MNGLERIFRAAGFAVLIAAASQISLAPALAEEETPRDAKPLPDDLVALQGQWEARERRPDGEYRIEKLIEGNAETYRVYRNGELAIEHRADVQVAQEGPVKVFRWHNARHQLAGRAGGRILDGGYIYRLEQDEWTCVFGLLEGEPGPTFALRFRRMPAGGDDAPAEKSVPPESQADPDEVDPP